MSIQVENATAFVSPVHSLSGTGKDTLTKEYRDAVTAVKNAIEALDAITIHGRDYNSSIELYEAIDDRSRMYMLLNIVMHYLKSIYYPMKLDDKSLSEYFVKEMLQNVKAFNNINS
jgi:hypothetical protein